jgi:hypothetical protein
MPTPGLRAQLGNKRRRATENSNRVDVSSTLGTEETTANEEDEQTRHQCEAASDESTNVLVAITEKDSNGVSAETQTCERTKTGRSGLGKNIDTSNENAGKENNQETDNSRGACDAVQTLGSVDRPIEEDEDSEEDEDDDIGEGIAENKEKCITKVRLWMTPCQLMKYILIFVGGLAMVKPSVVF